jgi:class 3 adenylate cyclase/tetratricopeptide (TPR) repeat protein
VSERRVCSVLFADLVGFTPLSEARDPEEVRELLSRYFEVARTVIGRYGGVVEKFIGDAVMAVWGTPVAAEEDTERAVRAALELVSAVEGLGGEVGSPLLGARAGVVTGEVAVNLGAVGEGMVAGDAVNTAARVQATARPGSVYVDDTTRRLAERAITFEDEGSFDLKGKEHPERLFRAMRVLSGLGGRQRADALEAPLVGRDIELRTLKDLFHASASRRTPRLVVVSGPAGVGKSRLGWELEKYLDGLADTVLWHRGRCLSYGDGVTFWALAEIVRERFGIAEDDSIEVAAARLAEGVERFITDPGERDYVGVRLSRLLGVPYPSVTNVQLSRDELYAGWRVLFERLSEVAPVVILVEAAQRADEALLGFFAHLIDWTRNLPIFVLLFARPGSPTIDSGYGVGRNRSTLSLDPLDDLSMAQLVDALVPGLATKVRDLITERAQGIPLFAVETIRSLIDRGVVVREGDSYRASEDLGPGTPEVPETLHSLLAARLDALDPDARRLVGDASVLGSAFRADALAGISPLAPSSIEAGLDELVRRDILEVFADPLSPERGDYRFVQELFRQVSYETLARRDRKARHLAVAGHLRSSFANDGEEIAEVIARHYLDAVEAQPAAEDSGELRGEALRALVRAAERCNRSGAPGRAAENYAEAARIASPDEAPLLLEEAAAAASAYGEYEAAVAYAERARQSHLAIGDAHGAARAQTKKGSVLHIGGSPAAARRELVEAVSVLRPFGDEATVGALRTLAAIEIFTGNLEPGEKLANEALFVAQAIDAAPQTLAHIYDTKGHAALFTNRFVEARVSYETAARYAERAGNLAMVGLVQRNLADLLARTDPHSAVETAKSAVEHARRMGRRGDLGIAIANLTVALLELGEWHEAERYLRQTREVDHVEDDDVVRLDAWLAGLRGDGARVTVALHKLSASRAREEPQSLASVCFLDALAAECRGEPAVALSHMMEALEQRHAIGIGHESQRWGWPLAARIARAIGDDAALEELGAMLDEHPAGHVPPILRVARRMTLALQSADEGHPDAIASVGSVLTELRALANPFQLAHALIDYGELLAREATSADRAHLALAEAREIGERLACPPLVSRSDSCGAAAAQLA